MPVQNCVVLYQPDPEKVMVKGRNMGHRCGACHKASDAQIRMGRTILEYNVTCRLEFFHTFVGVRCLYIYLLPFPSH